MLLCESIGSLNYVHATLGYDTYDFDIKPWSLNTITRNIESFIGRAYAGDGTSFNIMLSGVARLKN